MRVAVFQLRVEPTRVTVRKPDKYPLIGCKSLMSLALREMANNSSADIVRSAVSGPEWVFGSDPYRYPFCNGLHTRG